MIAQGAGCWVLGAGNGGITRQYLHPVPGTLSSSRRPAPGTPHPAPSALFSTPAFPVDLHFHSPPLFRDIYGIRHTKGQKRKR